ncbi:SIR2 family protein [Solirubrobacter ginsenosidimutans]|uniref:SIR2 family protein n=1 Tax=Solirubrobacter ginsenosidimutans TaxID=490573 RepID=A0A9X3MZP7_9ACTN|nr:SIR2 family protein [Solirubrobacter ginsenosidimutans]MDA0166011.1 SIR2 family protein [Solirubrobacter ginsenosidimutans]
MTDLLRIRNEEVDLGEHPDPGTLRGKVEPWLAAVLQSEHLSLLLGNGLAMAIGYAADAVPPTMAASPFSGQLADEVEAAAKRSAAATGRGSPNIEDRIRTALALQAGLEIMGDSRSELWADQIDGALRGLLSEVLAGERGIKKAVEAASDSGLTAHRLLVSFLLTFASRSASRDRLNLFTTNYDRIVEFGCDLAGLRPIDRFVGALEPVFRSSRVDVDQHYNPPGIRGEPRYLEGVLRLGKIHGSLDWRFRNGALRRVGLPFGADPGHPEILPDPALGLMIYPNPAKDVETLLYPYAELMRDMSAALCRPNSALVTYGYGFGDDHINRVIADMLAIPSTHLVVISFDWCEGRLARFLDRSGRPAQVTLMVGSHFGSLPTLVDHYLPKPAIDTISLREAELRQRRQPRPSESSDVGGGGVSS